MRPSRQKKKTWQDWARVEATVQHRDPAKNDTESLQRYLASVPVGIVQQELRKIERIDSHREALPKLAALFGDTEIPHVERLVTLVQHTIENIRFAQNFGPLCSEEFSTWRHSEQTLPHGDPSTLKHKRVEDLILAMDCEMVETEGDADTLARVCVVNGDCKILLDRLVCPDKPILDYRTDITGFEKGMLEELAYTRNDAQKDFLKLMTPYTVLVGHTLHKDLAAMRVTVPFVADVSLLYGIDEDRSRTPSLALLVDKVLGQKDFRGEDGKAVHDCVEDTLMTMKVFLNRLRHPEGDKPRLLVKVSSSAPQDSYTGLTLFMSGLPNVPGLFFGVVSYIGRLRNGEGAQILQSVHIDQKKVGQFTTATITFTSEKDALQAFEWMPQTDDDGSLGDGCKKVIIRVGDVTKRVYVRTCGGQGREGGTGAIKDGNKYASGVGSAGSTSSAKVPVATKDSDDMVSGVYSAGNPLTHEKNSPDADGMKVEPLIQNRRRVEHTPETDVPSGSAPTANNLAQNDPDGTEEEMVSVSASLSEPDEAGSSESVFSVDEETVPSRQQWVGWKRALDDELVQAGGHMPWSKVRKVLVNRFKQATPDTKETEEHLGLLALSSIPERYLSKVDEIVRLPAA